MASTPAIFPAHASPVPGQGSRGPMLFLLSTRTNRDWTMTSEWRTILLLVFIGQVLAVFIVSLCLIVQRAAWQRKDPHHKTQTHSVRSNCKNGPLFKTSNVHTENNILDDVHLGNEGWSPRDSSRGNRNQLTTKRLLGSILPIMEVGCGQKQRPSLCDDDSEGSTDTIPVFNQPTSHYDRRTLGSCDTLPSPEFEYIEVDAEAIMNAQRAAISSKNGSPGEKVRDLDYVYKLGYKEKYPKPHYDISDSKYCDSSQPSSQVPRRVMGNPPSQQEKANGLPVVINQQGKVVMDVPTSKLSSTKQILRESNILANIMDESANFVQVSLSEETDSASSDNQLKCSQSDKLPAGTAPARPTVIFDDDGNGQAALESGKSSDDCDVWSPPAATEEFQQLHLFEEVVRQEDERALPEEEYISNKCASGSYRRDRSLSGDSAVADDEEGYTSKMYRKDIFAHLATLEEMAPSLRTSGDDAHSNSESGGIFMLEEAKRDPWEEEAPVYDSDP